VVSLPMVIKNPSNHQTGNLGWVGLVQAVRKRSETYITSLPIQIGSLTTTSPDGHWLEDNLYLSQLNNYTFLSKR